MEHFSLNDIDKITIVKFLEYSIKINKVDIAKVYKEISISSRRFTGCGYFTIIKSNFLKKLLSNNPKLVDVQWTHVDLQHGCGYMLTCKNSLITLEMYTYENSLERINPDKYLSIIISKMTDKGILDHVLNEIYIDSLIKEFY